MIWRFSDAKWRLLPGSLAAIAVAVLLQLGAFQPLENVAYTRLFQLRGEQPWDSRIVLVAIDDESLKRLGRFPFARRYYSQLVERLTRSDASVIAIDVIFSEPSADDAEFAGAIARSNRVVLAQASKQNGPLFLPVPSLGEAMLSSGHIWVVADPDTMVRKIQPEDQGTPAFGVAAVKAYSLVQENIPAPNLDRPILLNWVSSAKKLEQYSFADVIEGKVSDQVFRNKIVLVGLTALGFDAARNPFDINPPASGVNLQATLVHNLLQQNALRSMRSWDWLWLVLWGPALSMILSHWRTEMQGAIAIGLCLFWFVFALVALQFNTLFSVAFPIFLIITSAIAVALSERLRMNSILQRQVRRLWHQYQPDLVLHPIKEEKPVLPGMASMQRVNQLSALAEQFGRSQSTQAAIARSLSIGLAAADMDGLVWFTNPIATELLKLEIGTRLDPVLVPFWLSTISFSHQSVERQVRDRWYCLQLEPFSYGILLWIEDISDRKQIEANLDQQIEELNEMSLIKDDFLSTVSHELRTPLTNIKMAIQLLKVAKKDEKRNQYLEILENECDREINLINELLDLQRLEAGRHTLSNELIELQTFLPEVIEPFYQRTQARQQQLTLTINAPNLRCDRASLERIIVELVNNACKYTPPGEEILVLAETMGSQVEIRVSNSGVEIPQLERSKIFERFYRVPRSDKWQQGGTGLGLALVQKLVECMGGKIQVESVKNWTIFRVSLPTRYPETEVL
jgi:signal transduction histidine kinase